MMFILLYLFFEFCVRDGFVEYGGYVRYARVEPR